MSDAYHANSDHLVKAGHDDSPSFYNKAGRAIIKDIPDNSPLIIEQISSYEIEGYLKHLK